MSYETPARRRGCVRDYHARHSIPHHFGAIMPGRVGAMDQGSPSEDRGTALAWCADRVRRDTVTPESATRT
jgi:hypothetical protein